MAFTVQDDTGTVASANAYISVAEFKEYHDDRAQSYGTTADSVIQAAIVKATDYLDQRFRFPGQKKQGRRQATAWPREDVDDSDGFSIDGIPAEVKEATAEYALRALTAALAPDPKRDATGAAVQAKSEKVGPIEKSVTFVSGGSFQMPKYPAADQKLIKAGLVITGSAEVLRG